MLKTGTVIDIGDHTVEVLETPETTGDRYLIRIVAEPGGPGIKGDFPHIHPVLVETFLCVSGDMLARVGRKVTGVEPGKKVTAPVGEVHGFLNTGTTPLVLESEVIFPGGYKPENDLMTFAASYDRLRQDGPTNPKTGEPPLLQMAVLTHAYGHVVKQPGLAGLLMSPLAAVGRWRGYRSDITLPELPE